VRDALYHQGITSWQVMHELQCIADARKELRIMNARRRQREAVQREADAWYAAEVERLKERAPA
jgi:uncharacterized protein YfdQ (DUF2303 family)